MLLRRYSVPLVSTSREGGIRVPLADPERALVVIDQFLHCLRHLRSPEEGWKGELTDPYDHTDLPPRDEFGTYHEYVAFLKKVVVGRQHLLEQIAERIDPGGSKDRFRRELIGDWDSAEDAALRLRGILEFETDDNRILGPRGPSISAEGLHPWVWKAAVNLWDDRHYKQAVLEAANAVELQTRLKIGDGNSSGRDLYAQTFSIDPNRPNKLTVVGPDEGTEAWKSAQEGAKFLGMGCSAGIRNWAAHPTDKEPTEQEALEYLAAYSVLARWIDTAELV